MNIIGVHLREISLKREDLEGEFKIKNVKNNINVINVKERDFPASPSGKAVIFSFEYLSDYELEGSKEKSLGNLRFVGDVIITDEKKAVESIIKNWTKSKKIDDELLVPVIQVAFNMVNIEAIYLSRKVMLPSPVQLPQIMPKKDEK